MKGKRNREKAKVKGQKEDKEEEPRDEELDRQMEAEGQMDWRVTYWGRACTPSSRVVIKQASE